MSGLYMQQIGISLSENEAETANRFLKLGIEREPLILDRYLTYADWLIKKKERQEAVHVLHKALLAIPEKAMITADFIRTRGFSKSEVGRILPRKASVWYDMGRVMEQYRRLEEAEYYYLTALDFFDVRDVVPTYFTRLYSLYMRLGKEDQALTILRMGVEYIPDYSWFRVQLGDYYMRKGIPYRAKEEYMQGLRFDPDNQSLRKKLEELE